MASKNDDSKKERTRRPALSPQDQEDKLIGLAVGLAEKRLREGTATSQEVTHFLKLGSSRERLEQQKMHYEAQLASAKIDAIEAQAEQKVLYGRAIRAMVTYTGGDPDDFDELDEFRDPADED